MIKREYSVISIGTERNGSKGYMNISEIYDHKRIISPERHELNVINLNNSDNLSVNAELSIEMICMLRFQLIASLISVDLSNKNVCVVGMGAVGIGTYYECCRRNVKNVSIVTRRDMAYKKYKDVLNIEKNLDGYDIYIDCTGESRCINNIIKSCGKCSTVILLGTPRENPQIDLLTVHRNNLTIVGAHELNGIDKEVRNENVSIIERYFINNFQFFDYISKKMVKRHIGLKDYSDILCHKFIEPIHVVQYKTDDLRAFCS